MSLLSQTSEITIISKLSDTLRGLNLVVAFGAILITTEWHLSAIEQRRYSIRIWEFLQRKHATHSMNMFNLSL